MNDTELKTLEKITKAATPGRWVKDATAWSQPWEVGLILPDSDKPVRELICTLDVQYGNTENAPRALDLHYKQVIADSTFIAAAGPDTVLKLIEEIRRLRRIVS